MAGGITCKPSCTVTMETKCDIITYRISLYSVSKPVVRSNEATPPPSTPHIVSKPVVRSNDAPPPPSTPHIVSIPVVRSNDAPPSPSIPQKVLKCRYTLSACNFVPIWSGPTGQARLILSRDFQIFF